MTDTGRAAGAQPRVLVLSHLYPAHTCPSNGVFIQQHVEALADAGLRVRVVAPVPWAPWPLSRLSSKWRAYRGTVASGGFGTVDVVRIAAPIPPGSVQWMAGPSMACRLYPVFRQIRSDFPFDVIHSHTATPDGWAAWWLGRALRVPVVCSLRGSDINEYPVRSAIRRWATKKVVRSASAVVAVSSALASNTERLTGRRPLVIYNGIDPAFRPALPVERQKARFRLELPQDARVIAFVGRCERDKGVDELVHACLSVGRQVKGVALLIVGGGSHLTHMKALVAQSAASTAAVFVGPVPHGEIQRYLHAADAFVLPSHAEGMPNALLEAMACGLPCIASRVGGIPEVIEHGKNGLLVEPRCVPVLEEALRQVLMDRELAVRLGWEARAAVKARFTWLGNAEAHVQLYAHVLRKWRATHTQAGRGAAAC